MLLLAFSVVADCAKQVCALLWPAFCIAWLPFETQMGSFCPILIRTYGTLFMHQKDGAARLVALPYFPCCQL